jgi:hypothetical protein
MLDSCPSPEQPDPRRLCRRHLARSETPALDRNRVALDHPSIPGHSPSNLPLSPRAPRGVAGVRLQVTEKERGRDEAGHPDGR